MIVRLATLASVGQILSDTALTPSAAGTNAKSNATIKTTTSAVIIAMMRDDGNLVVA